MNSIPLSGEQLVNVHSRTDHELPAVGIKDFQPTNSWLENKQIQSALDSRKELLELERVEKWSNLMHAEWRPEKQKAAVIDKGKPWEVFGHHTDNGDWLFPEEVLLLMEMNLLECLYGEIPLSIQRGYSVLLGPEKGCSLDEYRVFAHLCRAGYRVVRHLPDLTVTAYERQVRLDQHLDQRTTYNDSSEREQLPHPDLPPKKILDLHENTEITLESSGPPEVQMEETKENKSAIAIDKSVVEIIDIADSSSESSDESSSDDSDIEIVHDSRPVMAKTLPNVKMDSDGVTNEDDDDLEIIEVPLPAKEIIVTTIESSDSGSESESERSYDGNWKRSQDKRPFVRPASMKNFTFSAVEEFCSVRNEKSKNASAKSEIDPSNKDVDDSSSADFVRLSPPPTKISRSNFCVVLSRTEILDLMPSMFGKSGKLMTLDSPDLRLIPPSIIPKQQFYTYNMSTLRARTYSTYFRGHFRGRRHFHGPRFNSYNPSHNPLTNYSNPLGLMQGLPMTQMFGSDVQSVARGMMQFASALLMNMPQNQQNNSLMPYNQHQNMPFTHHRDSHPFNSPFIFNDPPRNFSTPTHIRFSDSPFGSSSPNLIGVNDSFNSRGCGTHSRSSGTSSDFESNERTFSPSLGRGFNNSNRFNHSRRRPNSRNNSYQGRSLLPSPRNFGAVGPVFPDIDPAYIKPDIPINVEPHNNTGEDNGFIPLRTTNTRSDEVVEIVDLASDPPFSGRGRGRGISGRFQPKGEKRRKKRLRSLMAKKRRQNSGGSGDAPTVVFLDSPDSEALVKQENNVKTEPNCTVKQESVGINHAADIKSEALGSSNIKVEDRNVSAVKSELQPSTSTGVRVNIGQDSSGTNLLVEIKIEGTSELPAGTTPTVVKTENDISLKTEPDSSSEVQSVNVKGEPVEVKTEQGCVEVKKESPEESESNNRLLQNSPSNRDEVVAEVSSTSAFIENCDSQPENNTEGGEMEVESSDNTGNCDVSDNNVIVSETSKVTEDNLESEAVESSEKSGQPSEEESEMVVDSNELPETNVDDKKRTEMSVNTNDQSDINVEERDTSEMVVCSTEGPSQETETSEMVVEASNDNEIHESSQPKPVEESTDSCEMEVDVETEISSVKESSSELVESSKGKEKTQSNVSSWAEVKKFSVPLTIHQENEDVDKESEDEEDDEIRPLIRPKDCKTIGSVLSALQIFNPISERVPEDTPKLKISFDLYLATDFKKSHRGLPHYRIVVFSGSEPMPSPAQVREVQTRFQDSVPVLRAVVMPNSVVFYKGADVYLPVDDTSYTE